MLYEYFCLLDINECNNVTRACNSLANCVNTIGSYQCSCRTGFFGDGFQCDGKLNISQIAPLNLTSR